MTIRAGSRARGASCALALALGIAARTPVAKAEADPGRSPRARVPGYLVGPLRARFEPYGFFDLKNDPFFNHFGGTANENPANYDRARAELAALEWSGERESLEAAKLLDYLLTCRTWAGELYDAPTLAWATRAVRIKETLLGPESPEVAKSLARLGRVHEECGRYRQARAVYERAVALLTDDSPPFAAAMRLRLAGLRSDDGDYLGARRLFDETESVLEHSSSHTMGRRIQIGLAGLLVELGDFEIARAMLEDILVVWNPTEATSARASALNNLAVAQAASGDLILARGSAEAAVVLEDRLYKPWHSRRTSVVYNHAVILAELGDRAAAADELRALAAVQEPKLGPAHPELALTLLGLANLATLEGHLATARRLYDRSLPVLRSALGPGDPKLPFALASAAWFRWNVGEGGRALDLSLEAERLARAQFQAVARGFSEREALRYESVRVSGLDLALSALARHPDPRGARRTWDELVRSRALVLDEMVRRHRTVMERTDEPSQRRQAELALRRANLARRLHLPKPASETSWADEELLRRAWESKEIAERELARIAEIAPPALESPPGLVDVARALPEASTLVAYVAYHRLESPNAARPAGASAPEAHYFALVLDRDSGRVTTVPLGPAAVIDHLVHDWLDAAGQDPRSAPDGGRRAEIRYLERATRLRRAVWDPLPRAARARRQVFVVPDGNLDLVNFAALPDEIGGRYLVETGPSIHYLSAERDVLERRGNPPGRDLLVIAAPDPDAVVPPAAASAATGDLAVYRGPLPACGERGLPRFSLLPGADTEADAIDALWRAAVPDSAVLVLRGAQAEEGRFKRLAPGNRIVHLATHGFFLGEPCTSVLAGLEVPSRGRDVTGLLAPRTGADSPLLLSGLVMAGANGRAFAPPEIAGEDGILTAEEIASVDLRSVEWVVLSGCRTGLGTPRTGEGLMGLRRAFQVAGAATLVSSLWSVEDQSARLWIEALYRARLERHLDTAESVRRASLERLEAARASGRGGHPFSWGAFIAAGDWR